MHILKNLNHSIKFANINIHICKKNDEEEEETSYNSYLAYFGKKNQNQTVAKLNKK